jgi:hypothetical protein
MKKARKTKKLKPRLPVEAVVRLQSHPMTTKRGKKGYTRRRLKQQTAKIIKNERT